MRFDWPPEQAEFREEVRQFAAERSQKPSFDQDEDRENWASQESRDNLAELDRRGWLRRSWPKDLGGQEMSPWYQFLLAVELAYTDVHYGRRGTSSMIGPAIQRYGTDAQRAEYLPKIWSGEITCALGYSEPNAGSDLASLRTRAVRDGDSYVINGSKIWTSDAHWTSHVYLAVRTDPQAPKHRGISIFIVPLNLKGITIRPIEMMFHHRTNEVFFDDVVVPADMRIGEENRGWYMLATALDHERVTMAINNYMDMVHIFEWSIDYLRTERPDVLADPVARRKLAEIRLDLSMLRALVMTTGSVVASGAGPEQGGVREQGVGHRARHAHDRRRARPPRPGRRAGRRLRGRSAGPWPARAAAVVLRPCSGSPAAPTRSSGPSSPSAALACPEKGAPREPWLVRHPGDDPGQHAAAAAARDVDRPDPRAARERRPRRGAVEAAGRRRVAGLRLPRVRGRRRGRPPRHRGGT